VDSFIVLFIATVVMMKCTPMHNQLSCRAQRGQTRRVRFEIMTNRGVRALEGTSTTSAWGNSRLACGKGRLDESPNQREGDIGRIEILKV